MFVFFGCLNLCSQSIDLKDFCSSRCSSGPLQSLKTSILWGIGSFLLVFSRVLRDSTPRFVGPLIRWSVGPSVGPLVRPSHFTFFYFCGLWPHRSCPNDQVTSNSAPAHQHANGVAVYPALFPLMPSIFFLTQMMDHDGCPEPLCVRVTCQCKSDEICIKDKDGCDTCEPACVEKPPECPDCHFLAIGQNWVTRENITCPAKQCK